MRILKVILATMALLGTMYLIYKWETRLIPSGYTELDPTGKQQIEREIEEGYENYMKDRGL